MFLVSEEDFGRVHNRILFIIRRMRYFTNRITNQLEINMIQQYVDEIYTLHSELSKNDVYFVMIFLYYSLNLSEHYCPEFSLFDFKHFIDDFDESSFLLLVLMSSGENGSIYSDIRRSFFGMKT